MSKVMISLPEALLAELDAEVRRRGTSRSALLATAVRRELQRAEPGAAEAAVERSERRFRNAGPFDAVELVRAERDRR